MHCAVDSFFNQEGVLGASFIAYNEPNSIFIALGDHIRVWLSVNEALKLKIDLEKALGENATTNSKPKV